MSLSARRSRMSRAFAACVATLSLVAAMPAAHAEDIDLFTGLQSNAGTRPNVLLILDNASAWNANAAFTCETDGVVGSNNLNNNVGAEQCALYKAVSDLINDPNTNGKINLGLMMFGQGTNTGGQFRFPGVTPPTAPPGLMLMDTNGGDAFLKYIKTIDRIADNANNSQVGGGMQEAWAFFSGKTGLSGTTYTSPITNPCQRNFIIYIANALNNGKPQDTGLDPYNKLREAGASTAQLAPIALPKGNNIDNWGDEWARFLYEMDLNAANNANTDTPTRQNVITYTIAVTDGSKQSVDYQQFAASMGNAGGGGNYLVKSGDANALSNALKEIFNEMQAVNNVFASVSLPVSVNGQGSYLNQVYIGMFRPDGKARPRWVGNLKQYKLGYDSAGSLVMLDAGTQGAIDEPEKGAVSKAGTGFISPNARSYWTEDPPKVLGGSSLVTDWPADGFWKNASALLRNAKDAPDGEIVEKGGAAQMLRADYLTSQAARRLLTCADAKCNTATQTLAAFDTSNKALTEGSGPSLLKTTAADVSNMIAWMRGKDIFSSLTGTDPRKEAEPGPGGNVTVRGSIHGDVLHSRPVVVDYGGTTGVVVFYGANDGVFHAVNGNRTTAIATTSGMVRPGGELWGFVAPEFYGKLARLYSNAPEIQLTGSPAASGDTRFEPRDYFFDGTTTVYQNLSATTGPKVVIYLTARRGGRLIYALDVTDPGQPKYLWSKTNSDIAELGQTWSQPRVMQVRGHAGPVLIMGAGYDPDGEDRDPALNGDPEAVNRQGRGVIVLDAIKGDPVWAALADCTGFGGTCVTVPALKRAIPSDVAVVDRNGDGYADKAYVGDVGGNVWRIDFGSDTSDLPANWSIGKLAELGGAVNTNDARKFLYPPDVVATGKYDAVMIASGDREKPLYSTSNTAGAAQNVQNRFYMVKDPNTGKGLPAEWTAVKESTLVDATSVAYRDSAAVNGFYLAFGAGEKAVNAPLTVAGYTYFGTNTPSPVRPGACYPDLGIARGYAVSFLNGQGINNGPRYVVFDNGGLPPSPVFGMVSVTQSDGSTRLVPVLIGGGKQGGGGGDATSSLGGQEVKPASVGKRKRTYWYTEADKK